MISTKENLLQNNVDYLNINMTDAVIAVKDAIKVVEDTIELLLDANTVYTWDNLIALLDECDDQLSRTFSPIGHLNGVKGTNETVAAYEQCVAALTAHSTSVSQNTRLYLAVKQISQSEDFHQLSLQQQQSVTDSVENFERSGINLSKEKQTQLAEINKQLSELSTTYNVNNVNAKDKWFLQVDTLAELDGLPEAAIQTAKQEATDRNLEGYVLTLNPNCVRDVSYYAENRELRKQISYASTTVASELGFIEYNNTPLIEKILELKQKKAVLLGFSCFADLSLDRKMANSTDQVMSFLNDFNLKAKDIAKKEDEDLATFANVEYELESWDKSYFAEKLREEQYNINDTELKQYFPVEHVLQGLFTIVNKMYGITFKEAIVPVWDDTVKYFEVYENEKQIASFYLDLYARNQKRSGAWMDEAITRRVDLNNNLILPVTYLVLNSDPSVANTPPLMTHDNVVTLFHEFGHGLHQMLTEQTIPSISGTNNVPWDAVELPSQFMENYCWEPECLKDLSKHYQTGESLPDEMIANIIAAKNFRGANQLMRQISFSYVDMKLHIGNNTTLRTSDFIKETYSEAQKKHGFKLYDHSVKFLNRFSHIFGGGYAAGYYSYLWAESMSADAYKHVSKNGLYDSEACRSFRTNILAKGGSEDFMEMYKAFAGRPPTVDALLEDRGIM